MIPRYTPKDMAALWSSARRYEIWLEVELAGCEAMEHAGLVPEGTAAKIRAKRWSEARSRSPKPRVFRPRMRRCS